MKSDSKNNNVLADDINGRHWLEEIGMIQYAETFLLNLSRDGKIINRSKLSQIRLRDLPMMGITNYYHQKILMDHISNVLNYAYHSPVRRKELKKSMENKFPDVKVVEVKNKNASKKMIVPDLPLHAEPKKEVLTKPKKLSVRRRRSFDTAVWNSVADMNKGSNDAVLNLREGVFLEGHDNLHKKKPPLKQHRRRRNSFDENQFVEPNPHEKGKMYGNIALQYDTALKQLESLQNEDLAKIKNVLNCEAANILFLNEYSRDLLVCKESGTWYRIPAGIGVGGYVSETGQMVNIVDASKDWRYNNNLDIRIGFKTRTVLCAPIRSMRGGGPIIGVIECLNKKAATSVEDTIGHTTSPKAIFDDTDEQVLSHCIKKIAEDLHEKLIDLAMVAEKFSSSAIFVGSKGGDLFASKEVGYAKATSSSNSRNNSARDLNNLT